MKINFNDVLHAVQPGSIDIDFDGRSHRLKDPSVLDVAGFEAVRQPLDGESEEAHAQRILAFLRGWFDGEAPAFLSGTLPTEPRARRDLMVKVTALAGTIVTLVSDMASLPNVMARSQEVARAQIQRARSSSSGSDS